jgi:UDP-N-acetyl-D-glucosamine dehydrogenase
MQSTLDHAVQGDLAQKLKTRLENRTAKIGIMGLGYVGLPLALLFSEQKFPVTGFDIDKKKVDTLNSGGSYIYRITKEEIGAARSNGF